MKRPVLWAAVAFATGVALGRVLPNAAGLGAPLLAAIGIGAASLAGRDRRLFVAGLLGVFCAAGAIRWDVVDFDPGGDAFSRWLEGRDLDAVTVYGRVARSELLAPCDDYLQFTIDVTHCEGPGAREAVNGRALVRWNAPGRPVFPGDRVTLRGTPTVVLGPVNWDVRSNEDALRMRGVHAALRCSGPRALESYEPGSRWSAFNAAGRFRYELAQRLHEALPEFARPFVFAVWLGERSGLSRDEYKAFIRSGSAHILAVSGVHTSIVFVTVSFVLGRFIRIARYRALFVMAAIAVFALTAGARAATVRAAVMIAVYILADVFDRERDAPSALGIAGLLFLVWDPALLFDGGAQLSFLSIASILVFTERLSARVPLLPVPVRGAAATTVAVQLIPFPVAAGMFHLIPRLAPITNLLVIPLLGVALWLCLITSVTAFISPPLALLFGHATGGIVIAIQWIANTVSSVPFAVQPVTKPTAIAAALYWSALGMLVIRPHMRPRTRAVSVVALAIAAVVCWRPFNVPAQVRILDVRHGDATIVYTGDGKAAVIDGGDRSEYVDMGERVVIPSLAAMGVSHVDTVFASHGDRDHLGGLITLIERVPVRRVVMGVPEEANEVEQEFLAACAERGIPVVRATRGDRFQLGEAVFSILHPPEDWVADHSRNDMSLVIRLDWEGPRVLFPGDVELAGERMLAGQDVSAEILKAPHHGSNSSSSIPFIRAADPSVVLISAGDSRSRLSDPEAVIERYLDEGIAVRKTSVSGGLLLRVEEDGYEIEGAREDRGYPGVR